MHEMSGREEALSWDTVAVENDVPRGARMKHETENTIRRRGFSHIETRHVLTGFAHAF
jgi:hypothetical protein